MDLSHYGIFIASRYCEPCQFQSNYGVNATEFCVDCLESHCSGCAKKHRLHKLSAKHREIPIKAIPSSCHLCKDPTLIESYCLNCKEFCPRGCSDHHNLKKCSSDHELVELSVPEDHIIISIAEEDRYADDTDLKTESREDCTHTLPTKVRIPNLDSDREVPNFHGYESGFTHKDTKVGLKGKDNSTVFPADKKSVKKTEDHLQNTGSSCQSNKELHANERDGTFMSFSNKNAIGEINFLNASKDADASYTNSPKWDVYEKELKSDLHSVQEDSAIQSITKNSGKQKVRSCRNIELHSYSPKEYSEESEASSEEDVPRECTRTESNRNKSFDTERQDISVRDEATQRQCKPLEKEGRMFIGKENERFPVSTVVELLKPIETKRITTDIKRNSKQPGKPSALYVQSNHLTLSWPDLELREEHNVLEVFLKEAKFGSWRQCSNSSMDHTNTLCTIDGLRPDTQYIFKIRLTNERTGKSGPFSSVSDVVQTKPSPAMLYKSKSTVLRNSMVYQLPMEEDIKYLDRKNKIRKYDIGHQASTLHEKTVLLIGESGSGKSTMIDCLANYSLGVTVQDPFRFTLTCGENADSQSTMVREKSEWITIYTLHPSKESAFPFVLNLIDTPGLGRSKLKDDDEALITSVEVLLKHIEKVDVVGFVVKSSDSRLSVSQRLLFDSFLNLFGNDISENMCALITFCDSQTPPVVNAMSTFHHALPHDNYFCFNNCSLFSTEKQESNREAFWKLGKVQFEHLLKYLSTVDSQTVALTLRQLDIREEITYKIQSLEQFFVKALCGLDSLIKKEHAVQEQKDMKDVEEVEVEIEVLEPNSFPVSFKEQFALTCTRCNRTCCKYCNVTRDCEKMSCNIFKRNQYCSSCHPKLCHVSEHKLTQHTVEQIPSKRKTVLKVTDVDRCGLIMELNEKRQRLNLILHLILKEMTRKHNDLQKKSRHPAKLTISEKLDTLIDLTSFDRQSYPSGTEQILRNMKAELDYGQQPNIYGIRLKDVIEELDELD